MKYAHSIRLTVFSYENENSNALLESFLKFFPFNLEENKIELKKTEAKGANESIITIFEIILAKTNLINRFLDFILTILEKTKRINLNTRSEEHTSELQ